MRFVPILAAASAVVVAVSSCSDTTGPTVELLASTSVSKSTIRVGDSVTIGVTITNLTHQRRIIPANECPSPYVITKHGSTLSAPGPQFCTADARSRTIEPGGAFTFSQTWRASLLYDASGNAHPIVPGDYMVGARISVDPHVMSKSTTLRVVE